MKMKTLMKKAPQKQLFGALYIDLTEKARKGKIDPLIGREDILERTIQVLSRRLKNNPFTLGIPEWENCNYRRSGKADCGGQGSKKFKRQ